MIDSSVLIDAERQRINLAASIPGRETELSFIAAISVSELWHGVHRAPDATRKHRRAAFVESIVSRYAILPVDVMVAEVHAELWAKLAETGAMIGMNDLWIAATAISNQLSLVTSNVGEFERVPGLELIQPKRV